MMHEPLSAVISAIRSQPWAILPDYLRAVELIALRMLADPHLEAMAADGHKERMAGARTAVAAVGLRLEGARSSTVRNGVAVVPMIGVISPRASMVNESTGGTSLDVLMHDLRVAEAHADVSRIVLMVDSPGGVVSGLSEAAAALRGAKKPVVAFVTGVGASAAYWLASQAKEIVMDASAAVGSIGVMMTVNHQELPDASGMREHQIISANAPMKRPDPTTEDGRAACMAIVNALEDVFIADVAQGRGVTADRVKQDFGRGSMLAARQAVAIGMADRIGTLESLLAENSGETRRNGTMRKDRARADVQMRLLAAQTGIAALGR